MLMQTITHCSVVTAMTCRVPAGVFWPSHGGPGALCTDGLPLPCLHQPGGPLHGLDHGEEVCEQRSVMSASGPCRSDARPTAAGSLLQECPGMRVCVHVGARMHAFVHAFVRICMFVDTGTNPGHMTSCNTHVYIKQRKVHVICLSLFGFERKSYTWILVRVC